MNQPTPETATVAEGTFLEALPRGDAAAIIEAVERLGGLAFDPAEIGVPNVLLVRAPQGTKVTTLDLEQFADTPRRKAGEVQLTETESLASYVIRHATEATTMWGAGELGQDFTITAVINDHAGGEPGHRDHRAVLTLQRTPSAKRWVNANTKMLDQQQFAQLIEDGLADISDPDAATLLEIAQTLHGSVNASFRSGYRLQDGQIQAQYVQEIQTRAGSQGDLALPEKITLSFSPFYGADPMSIEARLRIRIAADKATFGVWLIRPEERFLEAFGRECLRLTDLIDQGAQAAKPPLLAGTPD